MSTWVCILKPWQPGAAWRVSTTRHGSRLFDFIQKALDKLSRYSELGLE